MSPQENTKIEQIVEAFENLAIAVAHGLIVSERFHPVQDKTPEMIALNRADARNEMASALRDFLRPALRVVAAKETYAEEKATLTAALTVPYGGAGIDGMKLA